MVLTGKMLESDLVAKGDNKGTLEIKFKGKIARYHNDEGAGRGKVIRRLLPTKNGETFKKVIMQRIIKRLNQLVKSLTQRQ